MTFDHILFPIDFSERCRALNKQVEWLAERFNSRVTLLNVFEMPASWYPAGEATFFNMECFEQLKQSQAQRLKDYVLNVPENRLQRILLEGTAASQIAKWVNDDVVDLVAIATQGHGALEGMILGSVATKVLHSTQCPVWTDSRVHAPANNPSVSKILCAIEIMEETVPLLRFTQKLAQDLNAVVQLIHSFPEAATLPNRYFDFDLHRKLTDDAKVEIGKLQREAGTAFPLEVSGMEISEMIKQAGTEDGTDLVVIGRGKAQKAFGRFQSHAYEIIKYAPCPVLSYALNQQEQASATERVTSLAVT